MIQSAANGVPKRRNMWSQVSHQPPISSNMGLSGCGQCRSSKTQKRLFLEIAAPLDRELFVAQELVEDHLAGVNAVHR